MNAHIDWNNTTISGSTLHDLRRQLSAMLKVEGPRGLTATTDTGATIHVELYEGKDYIKLANGRMYYHS